MMRERGFASAAHCGRRVLAGFLVAAAVAVVHGSHAAKPPPLRFVFGAGPELPGFQRLSLTAFSAETGYGFEGDVPNGEIDVLGAGGPAWTHSCIESSAPYVFSVRVPTEGNYRVTVGLGNPGHPTSATVKAELRRLMLERVVTQKGEFVQRSFIVNVRSPRIVARHDVTPGAVKLKAPRETTQEAWAWDDLLTLEFSGISPSLCSVEVELVRVPTIFLLGDSTVCDQSREPFASWGQMLPAFFTEKVAIANHGESGETYRDSIGRRRLDKIISVMQRGDWLLMQFGHNDQKQVAAGTGGPFTTYQDEMRQHIAAVRRVGGHPVLVTPMERRAFDAQGRIVPSLADYAVATRTVAREDNVPCLDLHAMSIRFYEALGPERSALAFAAPGGVVDNTHHNNYGGYELARCIVQAIRDAKLPIAKFVRRDVAEYDPTRPDAPESFTVPSSPVVTTQRPLGE